jgi:solute carrier family 45 protein 1/2/4
MFSTLFISSTGGAFIIFGFVGVSWAVANWIPCALLGARISESFADDKLFFSAGTIFGLHNVAICVPQIVISLGTSIFWKLDKDTPTDPESIAWVLRIGGVAALAGAWFTKNVERSEEYTKHAEEDEGQKLGRMSSEESFAPMAIV